MKRSIQALSFLALVLIFGGATANAQFGTVKVDADVPFDFVVGDRSFAAGKYVIRVTKSSVGIGSIEIRDAEGKLAYIALASNNGDRTQGISELRFDRVGGRPVLSKIVTPELGYSIPLASENSVIASNGNRPGSATRN